MTLLLCPGKVSRGGGASEDSDAVAASCQQLGKPYKAGGGGGGGSGSSQVVVVTKPVAVSSSASHSGHVVRTRRSGTDTEVDDFI